MISKMHSSSINLNIIPNIPDIHEGDDISQVLITALEKSSLKLEEFDIICMAHKVFSKAEGCIIKLKQIDPSTKAIKLAKNLNKDPRKVEVILRESIRVIRSFKRDEQNEGTLICEHKLGFICANSGVDESNIADEESVIKCSLGFLSVYTFSMIEGMPESPHDRAVQACKEAGQYPPYCQL